MGSWPPVTAVKIQTDVTMIEGLISRERLTTFSAATTQILYEIRPLSALNNIYLILQKIKHYFCF